MSDVLVLIAFVVALAGVFGLGLYVGINMGRMRR